MAALLLCELPPGSGDARSWILGQVTLLASRAEAALRFVASEQRRPGELPGEVIAIEVASIERAKSLRSAWQSTAHLSSVEFRLLRPLPAPPAEYAPVLFP